MDSIYGKACICLFIFFMNVEITNARQSKPGGTSWSTDTVMIKTEYVTVDFRNTDKLKHSRNLARTGEGIQIVNSSQKAVLLSRNIPVPVDRAAPFLAVGSRLIVSAFDKAVEQLKFQIRSSPDGRQWGGWQIVEIDDHLTMDQDTLVNTLLYLPQKTKFIQFKVAWQTDNPLQLHSLKLSFTSPGATPPEKLQALKRKAIRQNPKLRLGEKKDYPMPEYITRTGWNCPDGQEPSGPVSLTDVTHQIIHHSAGTNTSSDWPAVVRSIWDYHVNTNGWSDIGYNWLVDPNGVIYQGRGWINGNDEVQGAHFCGTNSNTMGACLLGNFEEVSPSSDALDSLEDLLAWKSDQKSIDPLAKRFHPSSGLNLFTISGHRDGCSTLCPGENLYVRLNEIRENVNTRIGETAVAENDIVLENNYPNPFADATNVIFTLNRPGNVRISIWDITGRMVEVVSDRLYEAERHSELWNASGYASGIYFCKIELNDQSAVQKMVLVQ